MSYDCYLYSAVETAHLDYQAEFDAFIEAQEKQFKTQIKLQDKGNNQDGK